MPHHHHCLPRDTALMTYRDGNGSGRAISRPPVKEVRVEIHTHTYG
jgi:hypothetical protein